MSIDIREIENTVAGMALQDERQLADAVGFGIAGHLFGDETTGKIFEAAKKIWGQGEEVDVATICREIGRQHEPHVMGLIRGAPTTQNFSPYLQAMLDWHRQMEFHGKLAEISQALNHRHPLEPLDPIVDRLGELLFYSKGGGKPIKTTTITQALDKSLKAAEDRILASRDGRPAGVSTGLPTLDRVIYGFQPGFVYILGARTAVGKTTMAVNMALSAAQGGAKVVFVTVEMSDADIADKMLTRVGRVHMARYLSGATSEEDADRIAHGSRVLAKLPILFSEVGLPSVDLLALELLRLVKVERVELVILDYLQLFEMGDRRQRNSREEAKSVSARLKQLARSLNVPILILSQLNRQAPDDGEPDLVHIAESDQIARDADVIMFLYRQGSQFFLSVAKNRRGMKVSLRLNAALEHSLFSEGAEVTG